MDFYERQDLASQEKENKIDAERIKEEELFRVKRYKNLGNEQKINREEEKLPFKNSLNPKALFSAYKEINFSQDWGYFMVIMFSIVADFFGFLPYVGGFFGLFFSIIIFVLYLLGGQLKKRAFVKTAITLLTDFLESIGGVFLINFLPLFTLSACLIYWLELSSRSAHKMQLNEE